MTQNKILLAAAGLIFCNMGLGNIDVAHAANQNPIGYLDGVNGNTAYGWAYDADSGAGPVAIHFYADNVTFVGAVLANLPRPDVNKVHGVVGDHGYQFTISVTGLTPGTHQLYAYAINYPAGNNPVLVGSPKSFTVSAPVPAPTISSFSATPANITSGQSTTLSWSVTGASTLSINQGVGSLTGSTSSIVVAPAVTTTYVLTAGNSGGAVTASVSVTVTPPADTTPPVISNIQTSNVSSAGVTIGWSTNESGTSQVEYGTTTNYGTSTGLNSSPVSNHSMTLSGLTANTVYHFRVKSKDAAGNLAVSADRTVTTAAVGSTLFRGVYTPPAGLQPVELLQDLNFSKGLRAQWSCVDWQGNQITQEGLPAGLQLGNCTAYDQPLSGYTIRTLPDPGAPVDDGKFWHLNEGYHKGPMDLPGGLHIAPGQDLQIHRMEVNSQVLENSAGMTHIRSMNNLGISENDRMYNTRLAHEFTSNRQGAVMIYANTKNEVRNVATDCGPTFANDTWPTFYIEQNFKQLIDTANFSSLDLYANLDIPFVRELSGWTGPYKDATASMTVLLRKKSNPFIALFLVNSVFSLSPVNYEENLGVDQWGQGMYRASIQDHGGPLVLGAPPRMMHVDVLGNLRKAIAQNPALGNVEDYYIAALEIGWESLGYHEYKLNVSNVSMRGTLNQIFYPKVFNAAKYLQLNPDLQNIFGSNLAAAAQHWKNYGAAEGRQGSAEFSAVHYLQRYPDLVAAFGATNYLAAIHHYVNYGINEGRDGS